MRTHTVTKRVGEFLGPVDWSFGFAEAGKDMCSCGSDVAHQEFMARALSCLHEAELALWEGYTVYLNEGSLWNSKVLCVGMYDGWPFWKPYPFYCTETAAGADWRPWYNAKRIRIVSPKD